jgi:hypothetical protein
MDNRTVLQWDKDDCAAVGLVKFDLLGLGMLSALYYAFDCAARLPGESTRPARCPPSTAAAPWPVPEPVRTTLPALWAVVVTEPMTTCTDTSPNSVGDSKIHNETRVATIAGIRRKR